MCLNWGVVMCCSDCDKLNSTKRRFFSNITPIDCLYAPQTNGEISVSIMQNWTLQAKECYEINSDCSKCSLKTGNYSFVCQMPKIVKALLKAYGPPLNKTEIAS